jgi:hypothetical protein
MARIIYPNKYTSKHTLTWLVVGSAVLALCASKYAFGVQTTIQTPNQPIRASQGVKTTPLEALDEQLCGLDAVVCDSEVASGRWRTVTAYNVGDPAQTDSTPCIGAAGAKYDLCEMVAAGKRIVATNELPLFSQVKINGKIYTVLDRTNGRYAYRYDIAMAKDQKSVALAFGSRTLKVELTGDN